MKRLAVLALLVLVLVHLAGCAPTANSAAGATSDPAGFWLGLWHGFTVLFTFVFSLFNDKVGIYEVHNSGGWYNFGYILGIMMFWSGSGGGAAASRSGR